MIVVDTNIISYLFLPTKFTSKAESLFIQESDWAAPILWRSEFRNVLALYIKKQHLTLQDALLIQDEAESLMIEREFSIPFRSILPLVERSDCSAYDCEFVALAQHFGIDLVTADKGILREFPTVARKL